MHLTRTLPRLLLALTLLQAVWAGPALAQESGGPIADQVQGRNSWLREQLEPLGRRVHPHVLQLSGGAASGYGVAVEGGYVLTSDALIGQATSLVARDSAGKAHRVLVHGRNGKFGVALLRFVDPAGSPAPIALGSSKDLVIGQIVAVVGVDAKPLAAGVISAKGRPVDKNAMEQGGNVFLQMFSDGANQGHLRAYPAVLQHDGLLEPEHFGAPLVDRAGKLVGINVAYPFRGSAHAVGVDEIQAALPGLTQGEQVPTPPEYQPRPAPSQPETPTPTEGQRPYLGAGLAPASPEQLGKGHVFGLYVRELKEGGPAAKAGLRPGDVVVRLDGKAFPGMNEFAAQLLLKRPGDRVTLTVLRGAAGVETQVQVKLGAR